MKILWGVRAALGLHRTRTLSTVGASDASLHPARARRVALRPPLAQGWHVPRYFEMAKRERSITQTLGTGRTKRIVVVPVFVKAAFARTRKRNKSVWSKAEIEMMGRAA